MLGCANSKPWMCDGIVAELVSLNRCHSPLRWEVEPAIPHLWWSLRIDFQSEVLGWVWGMGVSQRLWVGLGFMGWGQISYEGWGQVSHAGVFWQQPRFIYCHGPGSKQAKHISPFITTFASSDLPQHMSLSASLSHLTTIWLTIMACKPSDSRESCWCPPSA